MRVVMHRAISGTRDGQDWPAVGESVDLPDDEAAVLLAQGMVVAPSDGEVESASLDTTPKPRRGSAENEGK